MAEFRHMPNYGMIWLSFWLPSLFGFTSFSEHFLSSIYLSIRINVYVYSYIFIQTPAGGKLILGNKIRI